MNIDDLDNKSLHHAYLVRGNSTNLDTLQDKVSGLLEVDISNNPDILNIKVNALTVSEARMISDFVSKATLGRGSKKVIFIYFSSINLEAQNILLKTLEEPTKDTYIFMLTPNVDMLLPTVLSRCMQIDCASTDLRQTINNDANIFIKATVSERLKIIEKIIGKTAKINFLAMQPGDVQKTYADVSELKKNFNYSPDTAIEIGIKNFIEWYKKYYISLSNKTN